MWVVSATTGAGKTALFEMALVRLFDPDLALTGARRAAKEGPVRGAVPGLVLVHPPGEDGFDPIGLVRPWADCSFHGFPSPFFLQASVDSKVPLEFRQLGYIYCGFQG